MVPHEEVVMMAGKMFTSHNNSAFRPARLFADEGRVQAWFDLLGDRDRQRLYTIPEIRAAVSIPATRLRIVLYRLGWRRRRADNFGIHLYQGPFYRLRHRELESLSQIIGGSLQ
jgi:hypothetical protein